MKNHLNHIALVRYFRQAVNSKDIPTVSFYSIIMLISFFLISLPFCPWSQQQIMEKFHLRSSSFFKWSALQFVPSMYNFANEFWLTPTPLSKDILEKREEAPQTSRHMWVNHYPLRLMTFSLTQRRKLFQSKGTHLIYLKSSFRDNTMISAYKIESMRGQIHIQRLP